MPDPELPDTAPEPNPTTPTPAADLAPADCAARLAELFPAVFGPGAARPLKLRIQADIQQRAPGVFTRKALSIFLHRHTTSNAYLRALVAAAARSDLDGNDAGEVSDEHREAARVELERRRAIHDARRAAEQAARRQARDAEREQQRANAAEDAARRQSAALARAFETTTLTRANFCALKGLTDAELDAALALARQEQRPPRDRALPRPDQRGAPPGHRAQRPAPRAEREGQRRRP